MIHMKRHRFLAQFSIPFHMVCSVFLRVIAQKTTFWLVEILYRPIRSFYSMVFEANTLNKKSEGYGKLCQKMVYFPVYHFVWGHLGFLQDVICDCMHPEIFPPFKHTIYIDDAFRLAHGNFSSQLLKKKDRVQLVHHRVKVFPITKPLPFLNLLNSMVSWHNTWWPSFYVSNWLNLINWLNIEVVAGKLAGLRLNNLY